MSSVTSLLLFVLAGEGEYPWWNYPGLELWKFVNLLLFVIAAYFVLRRPIREGFRARMEGIKSELDRARRERDQAMSRLGEVEGRFEKLEQEIAAIRTKAAAEAEAERQRIKAATEAEILKLREQANREIESASKAARQDLKQFAAHESVRLAGQILEKEIGKEDDERLMKANLDELRRTTA